MAQGVKTYSGDTFRNLLKQYSKDRCEVDPVYRADFNKAMAERRRQAAAGEKAVAATAAQEAA